jgi:RNA polymerase sigma-70 factor (ECF subfamily)
VYAARSRYRPDSRFSTYIYRVAKNHCLNLRARREHALVDRSQEAADQPAATATPAEGAEQAQLRLALMRALALLPDTQATALVLCHYEGMSQQEAAAVLEVSESAVKSLVFRARERLVELLRPELVEGKVRHAGP